jgi:hypothetical protein
MSRPTLFESRSEAVLEALKAGATIGEAAIGAGTTKQTVNGWLSRGRKQPGSMYGRFAASVDTAFAARKMPATDDRPADRKELMLLATKAARSGSVPAMKLLAELLEPTDADKGDALSEFDK